MSYKFVNSLAAMLLVPLCAAAHADVASPVQRGLKAEDLAVIINTTDPLSVAIAGFYVKQRRIPAANIARVRFDFQRDELPREEFARIKATVESELPARVQAYALTWARPYRVGCTSITSAFALSDGLQFCSGGCHPAPLSPYYDSPTSKPFSDLRIRPAMSIAAVDLAHAKALIARGVGADGTGLPGTAYLVATNDPPRNVRAAEYAAGAALAEGKIQVQVLSGPSIDHRTDVAFYFIGASDVSDLSTNRFLPGAIADHLTSFGGMLTDSSQMSSLRWLEAGATGSYGTVVEPCNFLAKFPDIRVVIAHYLAGETLIEAYWKSVAMPAEGLFIGEPLAAPFRRR